jgi:hypothetical protein
MKPAVGVMTERSLKVTAVVNGLVMGLLPLTLMLLASLIPENTNTSATVHGGRGPMAAALITWMAMWKTLLPLALIAGWRTLVYARRWALRDNRVWRGVLEAGICGFLYLLLFLTPSIVKQPMKAPPYVVVYGGIAFFVGLAVGLILRLTALLVLKISGSTKNPVPV